MALRTGYGTGEYSAGLYSRPQVFEGAVSAVVTCGTSSIAQRIHIGSVTDSIAISTAVIGVRVQSGAASDSITTTTSVAGYTTIVGAVAATITCDVDLYWNRVKSFAVSDIVQSSTSVGARYKWIDASEPTTVWAEADYLERAA
tara:strand:+ start:1079 stop:1510 length:432 start_codon:yes stop_codon:yes gene_type:complete